MIFASNPLYAAYADADLIGKAIFLALLGLSVISWVIFIQKTRTVNATRRLSNEFKGLFEKTKSHPLNVPHIPQKAAFHPFFEVYLILKERTLELLNKNRVFEENKEKVFLSPADIDLLSCHLSTAISNQVQSVERNLFVLSTVITLGPFLGLLGTVWGILTTFSELSTRTSSQSNEAILSGLAMALGTTIIGLLVAIPALIAYNYLRNTTREFQTELEDFSTTMLATVELQYRKAL